MINATPFSVKQSKPRSRSTSTQLYAVMGTAPSHTWATATGLLASSLVGILSERTVLPPNTGILGTLITSAVLSNLGWVPATHALYNLCWSIVLPASLAFLLIQKQPQSSASNSNAADNKKNIKRNSQASDFIQVGIAFVVASFASFLGCTLSFLICRSFPTLWFSPVDAAIAGGCLCASYIGGSVNFFATARVLTTKSSSASSLLSSMAAADLLVMALYFGWMSTALRRKRLLKFFHEAPDETATMTGNTTTVLVDAPTPTVDATDELDRKTLLDSCEMTTNVIPVASNNASSSWTGFTVVSQWIKNMNDTTTNNNRTSTTTTTAMMRVTATLLVSLLAWNMASLANTVELWLNPILPGTSCAVIALLGTALQRITQVLENDDNKTDKTTTLIPRQKLLLVRWWHTMQEAATPLSNLSFQLFFSAVGMSANLGCALQTGPASVWFSGIAIITHVIVTLGLCRCYSCGWGSLFGVPSWRKKKGYSSSDNDSVIAPANGGNTAARLQLRHVLVASNAAIGGPATAAAFAGQQKTGLTLAATLWGVVGYGVGTNLGIAASQWYQSMLGLVQ